MAAKALFCILVTLFVAQGFADPLLCPNPEDAKLSVFKEEVHIAPALFGRTQKLIRVPIPTNPVTCVTLSGFAADELNSSPSITAIGISEDYYVINLVSNIKRGINVEVEVYTK